jgi:aspartate aminotransferase-like enzyme
MMVVGRLLKSSIDFELLGNSKPSISRVGRDGASPSFYGNCRTKLRESFMSSSEPTAHYKGSATLASGSAAVSALIEALQRGDAVIFLEIGRFGRDLRRVERNLLRIFLSLDFDEALDWLFHRFRQIV